MRSRPSSILGQQFAKTPCKRYKTISDEYLDSLLHKEAEFGAQRNLSFKKRTSTKRKTKIQENSWKIRTRSVVDSISLNGKITRLRDRIVNIKQELFDKQTMRQQTDNVQTIKEIVSPHTVSNETDHRTIYKPIWYFEPLVPREARKESLFQIQAKQVKRESLLQIKPKYTQNCQVQTRGILIGRPKKNNNFKIKQNIAVKVLSQQQIVPQKEKIKQSKRQQFRSSGYKKFRKIVNCILFPIYLKSFNKRMRLNRKLKLDHFVQQKLSSRLLQLKEFMSQHSAKTLNIIEEQSSEDYLIYPKDDVKIVNKKIEYIKSLVSLELRNLQQCIAQIIKIPKFVQMIYHICRHGSYARQYSLLTPEELNLICVSEQFGYMSADKYLEMVSIVSFVFVKILLFNIFFEREVRQKKQESASRIKALDSTTSQQSSMNFPRKTASNNRLLVGNIIYQLCIDLQDWLLQNSDQIYKVSNWETLVHKFNFEPAENMTIKNNFFQKNELISGLKTHQQIKELYQIKQMHPQKQELARLVSLIHESICHLHRGVQSAFF